MKSNSAHRVISSWSLCRTQFKEHFPPITSENVTTVKPVFKVSLCLGFWVCACVCKCVWIEFASIDMSAYMCAGLCACDAVTHEWVWLSIKRVTLNGCTGSECYETVAAPVPCCVIPGCRISVSLTLSGHSMFTLRPWAGINLQVCRRGFLERINNPAHH